MVATSESNPTQYRRRVFHHVHVQVGAELLDVNLRLVGELIVPLAV